MPTKRKETTYKKIREEWNFTYSDVLTDFAISCVKSYIRDHPYAKPNEQTMIEISKYVANTLYTGMEIFEQEKLDYPDLFSVILAGGTEYNLITEAEYRNKIKKIKSTLRKWDNKSFSNRKNKQKKCKTSEVMYV